MGSVNLEYGGTFEWSKIDLETGEVLKDDVVEFLRRLPNEPPENKQKRSNFAVLYPLKFYGLINAVGSKKMEVIGYIIKNMGADNVLIATAKEIAEKCGASKHTVERTLQALAKANLIHRRPGVIMLNPQLLNRKHKAGEYKLMLKFEKIGADKDGSSKDNPPPQSNEAPQR